MRKYPTLTKIYIETKPFFKRGNGMISVNNFALYMWESDKAVFIREKIQKDKEMYSTFSMWIPKSKIIKIEVV